MTKIPAHVLWGMIACLAPALIAAQTSGNAAAPEAPGVPNFHQVNDHLFRGAQPLPEGFKSLAKLGIGTVIDLRAEHSSAVEAEAVKAAGMRYVSVPMNGFHAPSNEQITKILGLIDSITDGPVFIHCRRGADRTGTVIACYRIKHDHWAGDKAVAEAESFGMSFTEVGMKHYIRGFRPPQEPGEGPKNLPPAPATPVASAAPAH
jgi:tyrosine-protein phosphatase SIW14